MKKRVVICCDGTWNTPDQKERTNVSKIAEAVAYEDANGVRQLMSYHPGVGTGFGQRFREGAFGWGPSKNTQKAYSYIVMHYEPGDEIYLFGFSRGAYTAQSITGLIRNSGVLRREHVGLIPDAYKLYRSRDPRHHPRAVESQLFRRSFSCEERTTIRFIGVWDTVGALGIPITPLHFLNRSWAFHDVTLSKTVENAFHALAIDERRKWFLPTLWEQPSDAENQRLEQVWFAGVHSNVGGGYHDHGLSDIAFLWMKEKAQS